MLFRRNTHRADGSYREELEENTNKHPETWVLHLLDPKQAMTFDQLCSEVWKYNDDFLEEREDPAHIALGLVRCLEETTAVVVEE